MIITNQTIRNKVILALLLVAGSLVLLAPLYAIAATEASNDLPATYIVVNEVEEESTAQEQPVAQSPSPRPSLPREERKDNEKDNGVVTNELGVFSPWGTVKQALFGRARAGEEGVVFALTALDAKPTRQGDLRYQISYVNNTADTLRGVSVQVFLSKELQYLDSDLRPNSKKDGVVTFEVGKVAAGEEGTIQLETRLKKKKSKETFLSATLVYEDIDGGRHTVTATANNAFNGKNGNGFTASVLGGIGGAALWLFIIILIIALAFVAYQYLVLQASSRRA